MIKYEKNNQKKSSQQSSTSSHKTHIERKSKQQRAQIVVDLSAKQSNSKERKISQSPINQMEVASQRSKQIEQSPVDSNIEFKDSLNRSPLDSKISSSDSYRDMTVKKNMSPQIIAGRLTIKSINNLESSAASNQQEATVKKGQSLFKGLGNQQINSTIIMSNFVAQTPFDSTPIKKYNDEMISQEKIRNPSLMQIGANDQENLFSKVNFMDQKPFQSQQSQRYKDLKAKGQIINKERDSYILKQKKEKDVNEMLRVSEDRVMFQRPSGISDDEFDDMPPLSPGTRNSNDDDDSQISDKDHRFSVRKFQFNLISSLAGTGSRPSFIQRASNLVSKNNSPSGSSSANSKRNQNSLANQCSGRCSKGLKQFFYCCGNQNGSSRSKNENYQVFSEAYPKRKIVVYNNQESFVIQYHNRNSSVVNIKTEDFSDEVDEYDNDQVGHRLSIVKRNNVNKVLYSPGSRIAQQSNVLMARTIDNNAQNQQVSQPINTSQQQKLDRFVTKVPQQVPQQQPQNTQIDLSNIAVNIQINNQSQISSSNTQQKADDSNTSTSGAQLTQDIHRMHFLQTIQALHTIKNCITMPNEAEIEHLKIQLPPPNHPSKTKTIIFDMDETLIHCVDDIETEDPDVILSILFPDEDEPVNAGINIRPYIYECLEEANKYFQVGIFTASHQAYADAILNMLDPENKYFQFRLYRDNCVQTQEGYYVKDMRIFANRDLKDIVIIDNSVYSFSFQIDNGIPIIPFYSDKEDEEMLHLVYYLNCLQTVEDVRDQNREAFELEKLASQSPMDIINNYYTNNQQQMLLQNSEYDEGQNANHVIMEENEETQEYEQNPDEEEEEEDDSGDRTQYRQQYNQQHDEYDNFIDGDQQVNTYIHIKANNSQTTPKRLLQQNQI